MRIRRSGLREDGLEMLTARRRIVLQSIGPLLQLDFPPSDVAPLPAWGILAARGGYARPASLYPSIFRVGPRSSKLAAPIVSEPSLSHNNVPQALIRSLAYATLRMALTRIRQAGSLEVSNARCETPPTAQARSPGAGVAMLAVWGSDD